MGFEKDDVKSIAQATIAWTTVVPEDKNFTTSLSLCETRIEPLGKYLPYIDVDSRRVHVPRIRCPQFVIDIGTLPKIGR